MKATKKLTLSAISTALGVVFMALGSLIGVLDLTAAAFGSIIIAFIYIEVGQPYPYLVWLATSLLLFVLLPSSQAWLTYLIIFGIYPILKAHIERLKRPFWYLVKIPLFNALLIAMLFLFEKYFGTRFFETENNYIIVGLYVAFNVAFILYDILLTMMIRVYFSTIRPKFQRFLK